MSIKGIGRRFAGTTKRSRGFALIIVLWALVLAALIGTQVTALGRRDTHIAANLRAAAMTEAGADGAVNEAIFRMMRNEAGWDPDGTPHLITVGLVNVTVVVTDEADKINLNSASAGLLAALFTILGTDETSAASTAAAVIAWRGDDDDSTVVTESWKQRYIAAGLDYVPPFEAFQSVDELALVLGMNADLYPLVAPHLTIYGSSDVNSSTTDPVVASAIRAAPGNDNSDSNGSSRIFSINAIANGPDGAVFARHAVIRFGRGGNGYSVLLWERVAS